MTDLDLYALGARPFQLAPDPEFYFESKAHRKALSCLGQGLAQGEGFIVVTGDPGTGKSVLAAHLIATIDSSRLATARIVSSRLGGEDVVQAVATGFGLAAMPDKMTALIAIENLLLSELRAGRRCFLVIDEAQNLSADALEELRMISNFQHGSEPLLQILLLGQTDFREQLQAVPTLSRLDQRIVASHHLGVIAPEEVGEYVEHRMRRAGWSGENPSIDPRLYAEVAELSGGVPRKINQIFNRLIRIGLDERCPVLDLDMLQELVEEFAAKKSCGNSDGEALANENRGARSSARLDATLKVHDELIAELQEAVVELAQVRAQVAAAPAPSRTNEITEFIARTESRIAALEARSLEQQQTLRHTLTMLIEWIESGGDHRIAA